MNVNIFIFYFFFKIKLIMNKTDNPILVEDQTIEEEVSIFLKI